MAGWDSLERLVKEEVIQRRDEGCNTEGFIEKIEAAGNDREQLMAIYEQLMRLPIRPDFPFVEPSELEEIREKRPEGPRVLHPQHSESVWRDKFYGAWLGRSVGCALGKPLEQWEYMAGSFGNPGWKNVQLWFQGADAWPITTYVPAQSRAQKEVGLKIANVSLRACVKTSATWRATMISGIRSLASLCWKKKGWSGILGMWVCYGIEFCLILRYVQLRRRHI